MSEYLQYLVGAHAFAAYAHIKQDNDRIGYWITTALSWMCWFHLFTMLVAAVIAFFGGTP